MFPPSIGCITPSRDETHSLCCGRGCVVVGVGGGSASDGEGGGCQAVVDTFFLSQL